MAIRIWHQSFTVLTDLGAYDEALTEHFKKVARPDTTIELHGMREGTYRTNYPGDDIKHAAVQHIHALQFMAGAIKAEKNGADAYAISSLPDPALREIRTLVDIPVVGYGEAAMRLASTLGRKFGILVFIDELAELVTENAAQYGFSSRLAAAQPAGFRFGDVLEAFSSSPEPLIERFRQAARSLIAKGAEVIIPGEAPLCVMLARNGISNVDGVPVVDSLAAWVKEAEMLVDLQRATGMRPYCSGYFSALPDRDRVEEIFQFYHLDHLLA